MLTSVGRVAARRVLFVRAPPSSSSSVLRQHAASASASAAASASAQSALPCSVLRAARPFSVSRCVRVPQAQAKKAGAPRKTTTTKTAGKAASGSKKKASAKNTKKKAGSVGRPKKKKAAQTPEQKDQAERRMLKTIALLHKPALLPQSSYTVYLSQHFVKGGEPFVEQVKAISSQFKALPEPEMERLRATAQANYAANKQQKDKWLKSHPPGVVYLANVARRRLNRKYNQSLRKLQDDRQPRRSISGYTLFVKERAPEVTDSAENRFRTVAQEWKAMPESAKRPYKDAAAAESSSNSSQILDQKKTAKAYWEAQGVKGIKI